MMLSSYPFWWLALPVLLLPIWWHRQKRQRLKAEPLATARFLPAAAPEQLRVWQWRDRLLLLVRCLLLLALIAWLAATIFPWRGDTVILDTGVDRAWAEQQIVATGFDAAPRVALPANALQWIRQHERDWRAGAKLLVVARADQIAMPAALPQFSHQITLRTKPAVVEAIPAPNAGTVKTEHRIVLAASPERTLAWRSLFTAFGSAGGGDGRYVIVSEPDARTELIIWDAPGTAPPASWRARHWWIASSSAGDAAFPELSRAVTLTINGIALKYADSPHGRLWASTAWPPRDADSASAIYEAWQLLQPTPAAAYPSSSQSFTSARTSLPAITDAKPATWLSLALMALFLLERILSHARRN